MAMKQVILGVAITALLAGCGSSVKLDPPPVEDRTGSLPVPSNGTTPGGQAGAASQTGVASVDLSKQGGNAPQAVAPVGASVVYFDYDSFVLKPEYQNVVETQARYLRADARRKATLEGHTDERGGREYNLALGQRRAEAVGKALTLLGVGSAQVEAVSFGKEKPAALGHDEAAMALNRRVEVKPQAQ
jgi:peptidoglycan-associated lipoprotein